MAAGQADAHEAKLAVLAADLIDVPIDPLEIAAKRWSREQKWLPAASELIALAKEALTPQRHYVTTQAHADARNAGLGRAGVEWFAKPDGGMGMRWKETREQRMWRGDRIMADDVDAVNFGLRHNGSPLRFTADGFPYDLEEWDADPAPAEFPWTQRDRVMARRDAEERELHGAAS